MSLNYRCLLREAAWLAQNDSEPYHFWDATVLIQMKSINAMILRLVRPSIAGIPTYRNCENANTTPLYTPSGSVHVHWRYWV